MAGTLQPELVLEEVDELEVEEPLEELELLEEGQVTRLQITPESSQHSGGAVLLKSLQLGVSIGQVTEQPSVQVMVVPDEQKQPLEEEVLLLPEEELPLEEEELEEDEPELPELDPPEEDPPELEPPEELLLLPPEEPLEVPTTQAHVLFAVYWQVSPLVQVPLHHGTVLPHGVELEQ